MYLLNFILILIIILLLLLFIPLNISLYINSEQIDNSYIDFFWLYPFLNIRLIVNEGDIFIKIYIFKKSFKIKQIQFSTIKSNNTIKDRVNILKSLNLDYLYLDTYYGFNDPLITGILCGFINLIPNYLDKNEIYNNPNFMVDASYFTAKAFAKINIFYAIIKILKSYIKNYNKKLSYKYR
ncbi:DUF2953 domain-containing protein [Clostridium botulinum]|uniref:DUF2953 domain-containing protein n=2 Tax=Clostridium TaxID=1485 RepID=A0AAU8YUH6_CLOBO|nr:DUF2953 domain-containing protein [Clostridium sporogenes]AVP63675.1 DUF2953 domain-containing protein [Clostridium botulinum]MCF4016407.1 DUF2953 domain-containing protein [Clostridium sporogenes]NFG02544.1 DUF2953 domain-containing protein [Clostridium sporogenes]